MRSLLLTLVVPSLSPKGYALLEYENFSDAKDAIETCASEEGLTLMEEQLRADFAFVKPPNNFSNGQGRGRGGAGSGPDHRARSPDRR